MSTERVFKILIIGKSAVGKTAFVHRYVDNTFSKDYKSTVGVDFSLKIVQRSENDTVRLQLWDIAGQERYTSMTRVYYRDAAGCVILFDITAPASYYDVLKWKNDLDSKVTLASGKTLPCLLLANKCDLPSRPIPREDIEQFSREHGFLRWSEISVKDDMGVTESMNYLIDAMLAEHGSTSHSRNDGNRGGFIHLRNQSRSGDKDEGGCCTVS